MGSIIEKNQRSTISCYCTFKFRAINRIIAMWNINIYSAEFKLTQTWEREPKEIETETETDTDTDMDGDRDKQFGKFEKYLKWRNGLFKAVCITSFARPHRINNKRDR